MNLRGLAGEFNGVEKDNSGENTAIITILMIGLNIFILEVTISLENLKKTQYIN